jgi:hypothetical protein
LKRTIRFDAADKEEKFDDAVKKNEYYDQDIDTELPDQTK